MEEANYSLTTGTVASNSIWERHSRFLLQLAIHGLILTFVMLLILQIIFYSITFSKVYSSTPAYISPNADAGINTLVPCVFPRLQTQQVDSIPCLDGSFCPYDWTCSIIASQDNELEQSACLNNNLECGNLQFCTNYIFNLNSTDSYAKDSDLSASSPSFIASLIFLILSVFLVILFEVYVFLTKDFFEDSQSGSALISRLQQLPGTALCFINFVLIVPVGVILLISGIVFLTGFSPSIPNMTDIAAANCFNDHWLYLFSSTMLGWITVFFVIQIIYVFTLWFFLGLFTVKSLYGSIWDARVFVTIITIIIIIVIIGIAIEIAATVIEALS